MNAPFELDPTLGEMLNTIKNIVGKHWKDIESTARKFLENRKNRLAKLAEMRISGQLSQEKFESRLQDEAMIFEAEINALQVLAKAITQKAVNAAIDVFIKAVEKAVGLIP